jgi:hypothetical protein
MFHSGYMDSDSNSGLGRQRNRGSIKKRMTDGTSNIEINKAMATYLNRTGAGDYNLPKLTGEKIVESNRKNLPSYSFKEKTKLSWFPGRNVDFQASSSPPPNIYSPKQDKDFKNIKFSVGKGSRFYTPSSVKTLYK